MICGIFIYFLDYLKSYLDKVFKLNCHKIITTTLLEDSNKMIVYVELKSDQSWYVCLWALSTSIRVSVSKMRLLSDEREKRSKRIQSTLTWVENLHGICCLHLMSLYGSFVFTFHCLLLLFWIPSGLILW